MSYYVNNDVVRMVSIPPDGIRSTLPMGTYSLLRDMEGYYLKKADDFAINYKVYGTPNQYVDRIMHTFSERPASTGVLLTGEKGGGKSMLAKMLSIRGYETGIPTIMINDAHTGTAFMDFIQSIKQPAIVLLDEFEKVFPAEHQQSILTLLDGMYPSKKLFVLTSNEVSRINHYMINRPGRIFYKLDYRGIDDTIIREYCQDKFNEEQYRKYYEKISAFSLVFYAFTFDMLRALVEELLRYGGDFSDAVKILNVSPLDSSIAYSVSVRRKDTGKLVDPALHEAKIDENPAMSTRTYDLIVYEKVDSEDEPTNIEDATPVKRNSRPKYSELVLTPDNFVARVAGNVFVYEFDEYYVELTPMRPRYHTTNYGAF